MVDSGSHIRAIGWLDNTHPFPTGICANPFLLKLRKFADRCTESTQSMGWGVFAGFHRCDLCRNSCGTYNFAVPAGDLLYVAPELIVHYIAEHDYFPPEEFVAAILDAPLPDTTKYDKLIAPFRELHEQHFEQQMREM